MCDWAGQNYKRLLTDISSSGADGKMCAVLILTQSTRVRIRLLANSLYHYLHLVQIAAAMF